MFVPTHIYLDEEVSVFHCDKDVAVYRMPDTPVRDVYYYRAVKDGFMYCYDCWLEHRNFDEDFTPITLPCPSCNAEIQQQERVECECGWVAEAISEGSYRAITGMKKNWAVETAIPMSGERMLMLHVINSIHWLEIKAGE